MRRTLSLLAAVLSLGVCMAQSRAQARFDPNNLSDGGRQSYQKLLGATVFHLGGIGPGGETSDEEHALIDLLGEDKAIEALENLVDAGSPEGGLYGLVGLRHKDMVVFRRAYGRYLSKEEPPERLSLVEELRVPKGQVTVQGGCFLRTADRRLVAGEIDLGRFDAELKRGGN